MKAVILAAGVGKRLWPVTQHRPKCLIEIGGQTLLSRYLASLAGVGVQRADIVVGYKQEMIRAAIEANCFGVRVQFLVNEQFHRGSISSLWIARTALDDDVVIMSESTTEASDHQDTVFCVAFNKRSARIAIARTGKGTRLSTSINIRGDMLYLLLSCVSMPSWVAMPGPEKYLKRRAARSA